MFQQWYQDAPAVTPAQRMVRWLWGACALSDGSIADMCACTPQTINRIRHGRVSGRNLTRRIARTYEAVRLNRLDAKYDE